MARKLRTGGATSATQLDRTKKYKYNDAGTLTEFTGDEGATDTVFTGSKSNPRRIADPERNVARFWRHKLKQQTARQRMRMTQASQLNLQMRHVLKTLPVLMTQLTLTLTLTFSQITISGQTTTVVVMDSTGVTLSADGDLSMDGNAVVDGLITLGGGYGLNWCYNSSRRN